MCHTDRRRSTHPPVCRNHNQVYTKGDCKVDPAIAQAGDIDTSLVVLKFANGVIGTISNSRKVGIYLHLEWLFAWIGRWNGSLLVGLDWTARLNRRNQKKEAHDVVSTSIHPSPTPQAAYGYDQRVEVFGSKGMIQSENLRPNQCVIATGESVHQDLPFNFFMDRYKEVRGVFRGGWRAGQRMGWSVMGLVYPSFLSFVCESLSCCGSLALTTPAITMTTTTTTPPSGVQDRDGGVRQVRALGGQAALRRGGGPRGDEGGHGGGRLHEGERARRDLRSPAQASQAKPIGVWECSVEEGGCKQDGPAAAAVDWLIRSSFLP